MRSLYLLSHRMRVIGATNRKVNARKHFAVDGSLAHLVVQGRMVLRHDEEAVRLRRALLTEALGEEGLVAWDRPLSPDGSRLGVMAPERWRAYGLTDQAPA
jgi:hypothetical protein